MFAMRSKVPCPSAAAGFRCVLAVLMAGWLCLGASPAASRSAPDLIDITIVAVEGADAAQCTARTARVAEQSRTLSLATSPPLDIAEGLRTFYDHVLRLDAGGELQSTAQLSTVYVAAHPAGGEPLLRAVTPFVRVEVSRPLGTHSDAPSRIAIAWLWLHRLSEIHNPATGLTIQQPHLHRFDFLGEVVTAWGVWGHAVAPCRAGGDGLWLGAVAVWTYLPP
jgi:hypothetical protein